MGWPDVLDEMERRVEAAKRTVSHGGAPAAPFRLPADLGPLPAGLVGRAERIRSDTARVADQVTAAMALIGAALCRPQERSSEAPSYIDARV